MKKILLIIILIPFITYSQNEGNIWCFGSFAGLDFNSGTPTPLTNSAMSTVEGSTSIADNNGNLLFYSEGRRVWDKNHTIMPNGTWLGGGFSSTQGAIIVKKPGSNSIYYIFSVRSMNNPFGLWYSEVDMTLNGGLGDVSTPNNLISGGIQERICVIKHQNGNDFWIIVMPAVSNSFHAYLLTSSGLNTTPIITNIGAFHDYQGYLKASSDGKRIALADTKKANFELFDFDNSTGILSNNILFSTGFTSSYGPYGAEFSPNNNLLYISTYQQAGPAYQYNLLAGTNVAIENSKLLIGNGIGWGGALQNGPDGKMYHAHVDTTLNVINNPNVLGLGCNFVAGAINLAGKGSVHGLPTFINSIYPVPITANFSTTNLCFNDSTLFTILPNATNLDSVYWNFGDPTTGNDNNSSDTMVTHQFSDTGTFNVTLIVFDNNLSDTTTQQITIHPLPSVNLGNDTAYCPGNSVVLDATYPNATYLWQNGSSNPTFSASQVGTYWVEVSANGCNASDTVLVDFITIPTLTLTGDTLICPGETVLLSAPIPNSSYSWQNNSTQNTFLVTEPGTYWLIATDDCGSYSDTITVILDQCETVLEMPNVLTPNNDGINDLFIPITMKGVNEASIIVYNRWGQEHYSSNDITLGWDGKCNEQPCSDGTYFWVVNYTDINNQPASLKGTITLLK